MSFTRADDLLGAWRLESAVEVFDDGERRDEFGPNPEGYLCYNPAGIVSATLGDSARPPVPAGDPQSGTDDDYEKNGQALHRLRRAVQCRCRQRDRRFRPDRRGRPDLPQRTELAEGLSGRQDTA